MDPPAEHVHRPVRLSAGSVIVAAALACASSDTPQSAHIDYGTGTHVVLLGTGTPNAEPDRAGAAVAVVANGRAYLVDAGAGVVRRANAARAAGIEALRPPDLTIVFLTHLHSDHTVGLPDLILTPWVLGRDRPLAVYGPAGTRPMVEHLLEAYRADLETRLSGSEPANPDGYRVEVHEVTAGPAFEDANVRVSAFTVGHASWPQAFGYRFETADRTVVISGDAVPSEAVVEACAGCDVLVHEVYSEAALQYRSPVWQRYHRSAHTSTVELADLAARAAPKLLVLYHQLLWGTEPEALVGEITGRWDGAVVFGKDLEVY